MNLDELKAEYFETLAKFRDYEAAATLFSTKVAAYLKARQAPQGWSVDLFGDGKLKPAAQCKLHHDPNEEK
jgi:hypothetical protein